MKKTTKKLLTLVLPLFNEQEMLPLLFAELQKQLHNLDTKYECELLFVDDGSTDETVKELRTFQPILAHRVIEFTRNFGHQAALLAGIRAAKGDVVITMDSDLQHPPRLIHELLKVYEAGAELVFTKRTDDDSLSFFKKSSSNVFYRFLNIFSYTKVPPATSDFRLMNREAVDALVALPEKRIFLRGMVSWIGFRTETLEYQAEKRQKGSSKFTLFKMVQLALFGISSFSTAPLYISAFMALLFSAATLVYGAYVAYIRFILDTAVAGWSSVIFVLLGMGSILSFLLAILGIYIAALYDEVKERPIYIIRK